MLSRTARVCQIARSNQLVAVRALSSDAADGHRPVIQLHGLHARYASATYIAASKAGKLEKVEVDLNSLMASAQSSKTFSAFLANPMISRDAKTAFVNGLDKLSDITRNLLVTMAGNARLGELPLVASTFSQMMKAKRGEVEAKIISAEKLSEAELKNVKAAMQNQVPKGKSVTIETVVDPSIIGGLQVQIGDQFLDLSAKRRIDEISHMPLS